MKAHEAQIFPTSLALDQSHSSTVEPPISGHPKRRTPLISGQNIFPWLFSSQILIKKSPKGGHSINGHLHLADKIFCTEWSKTYFFSLQLADIEGKTGFRHENTSNECF